MISPFNENITIIVKRSAASVTGLILGMNFVSYQSIPFILLKDEAGDHAAENGIPR